MTLKEYRQKRRSGRSPEPRGRRRRGSRKQPHFVIQHHAASTDHYDFRLEIDGALVSWAVPKGPSVNPKDKRMARRTEDHPMEYESFEGVIPEGDYGAGRVIVWDRGTYESDRDMSESLKRGHLSFRLDGQKLKGGFALTRIRRGKDQTWLLVKKSDDNADGRRKPVRSQPQSVLSGRTLDVSPPVGLLCLLTLSTHGYEVMRRNAIPEMSAVPVEFMLRYGAGQMPRSKVRVISGATVCRGSAPAMACSAPRRISP